ncbi:hypothetical protein KSB_66590 [Ktedonobacter robiniae]|uniref:Transposase n=1 Tax=Ktedonobacter robiniae TaxID=2778365 RepID=A0ABQ3UZA7_9CHLR|nr:hypothetical protein KSB_66590 [Ktedonobacter robiniae]
MREAKGTRAKKRYGAECERFLPFSTEMPRPIYGSGRKRYSTINIEFGRLKPIIDSMLVGGKWIREGFFL